MEIKNHDIFTLDELKNKLIPVFQGYDIKNAILFGSYGKGNATEKSDVDLMVDSGLRGLRFVGLIDSIKSALSGKEVDVIDITHIDKNSKIEEEILKTGVKIYGK